MVVVFLNISLLFFTKPVYSVTFIEVIFSAMTLQRLQDVVVHVTLRVGSVFLNNVKIIQGRCLIVSESFSSAYQSMKRIKLFKNSCKKSNSQKMVATTNFCFKKKKVFFKRK